MKLSRFAAGLAVAIFARSNHAQVTFVDTGLSSTNPLTMGINNSGQLFSVSNGGQILRQPNGTVINLSPPPGYGGVTYWSINNSGALGGLGTSGSVERVVIRRPDGTFVTPVPTGNTRGGGINDSGNAVGWFPGAHDSSFLYEESTGIVLALPEISGATYSQAYNVNNNNMITGIFGFGGSPGRAWRYTPGGTIEMISFPPTLFSEPTDINDSGVVVGVNGDVAPFRWNADGTVTVFDGAGVAYGINNLNEAVGNIIAGGPRAMYWAPDDTARSLNSFLTPAQRVNWDLVQAFDINDGHTIVGSGRYDADGPGPNGYVERIYLLTIPEPGCLGVAMLVAFPLLRCRRPALALQSAPE